MGIETKEFLAWYKKEVEKGLIYLQFIRVDGIKMSATREDIAAENNRVNRLIAANQIVSRPDVI